MQNQHWNFPIRKTAVYFSLAVLATIIGLYSAWPDSVSQIPVHFTMSGEPDLFLGKFNYLAVFAVQAIVLGVILLGSVRASDKSLSGIGSSHKEDDIDEQIHDYVKIRNRVFAANLVFWYVMIIAVWTYLLFYVRTEHVLSISSLAVSLVILAVLFITISALYLGRGRKKLYARLHPEFLERRPELNSTHWKWGVIYYNPTDNRLFVPKKHTYGFTINHAHKGFAVLIYSVVVLLLVVAIEWPEWV